jgi:tetratricopeptide (TPR) repeat protein
MDLLRQATAHHQAGRLAQAQAMYRQILAANPDHPDALHLLGVLAHQNNHHEAGEKLIRRAVELAPQAAPILTSHGHVLRALGRPADAEAAYRAALRVQPNAPEFHHHVGLALRDQGRLDDAEHSLRQALRLAGDLVSARLDLGNLLLHGSRPAEAEACLRAALRAAPQHPAVLNALALALLAQAQPQAALDYFDQALALAPAYVNASFNRANCLVALERYEQAAAAFEMLAPHFANDAELVLAYARVLLLLQRAAQAESLLLDLTQSQPGNAAAWHELAHAYAQRDRADLALPCLQRLTALQPQQAQAWFELGMAYRDLARWPQAVAPHAEAVRLQPGNAEFRSCYAYALLACGDFAQGWQEFRWRTKKPGNVRLQEPEWNGAPTAQTVIIHAEQGAGDTIQFARFIPMAGQLARVVVACPPSLTTLLRGLPHVAEVADRKPVPAYDVQCPLMSLPAILGVAPDRFGESVPYLHADQSRVAIWRERLAHLPSPRVGLAWAGNPQYPVDRKRSMPVAALAPMLAVPGMSLVSLQMGQGAAPPPLFDAAPLIGDYADTAALIMALDLVISVDTSVAHLAGALGQRVWLMNRADTDWRWLLDRHDTPWYPTMRIFRQPNPGDWSSVVTRVVAELKGIGGTGLRPAPL